MLGKASRTRTQRSLIAAASWLLVTCAESPTGPGGPPDPEDPAPVAVALRETFSATIPAGLTHRYDLTFPADSAGIISVQATVGVHPDSVRVSILPQGSSTSISTIFVPAVIGQNDVLEVFAASPLQRSIQVSVSNTNASRPISFTARVSTVGATPERAGVNITTADTVASERLDAPGDVDEFRIPIAALAYHQIFVQPLGAHPDTLRAELVVAGGSYGRRSLTAPLASLTELVVPPFTVPALGTQTLRIYSGNTPGSGTSTGGYRVWLRRVLIPASVNLSFATPTLRTIGSGADSLTIWDGGWNAGIATKLIVTSLAGTSSDSLLVELRNQNLEVFDSVYVSGTDSAVVLIPEPGVGDTRIRAWVKGRPGQYRITHRSRWESTPESNPPALALGDSVLTERLEDLLDVDEYTINASEGEQFVLSATVDTTAPTNASASFAVRNGSGALLDSLQHRLDGLGDPRTAARITLSGAGPYRLRVGSNTVPSIPYRVALIPVDTLPEGIGAALSLDTQIAEEIGRLGDIDRYRVAVDVGDTVSAEMVIQQGAGPRVRLRLMDGATVIASAATAGGAEAPYTLATAPFVVTAPAEYTVEVEGGLPMLPLPFQASPYSLQVSRRSSAPEMRSPIITLGSAITGESFGRQYDVDRFTFSTSAAANVAFSFRTFESLGPDDVQMRLLVSPPDANGEYTAIDLPNLESDGDSLVLPTSVALPAAGDYVLELRVSAPLFAAAAYTAKLTAINEAPETIPVVTVTNSWISGESLGLFGDIDTLTLQVDSGTFYGFRLEALPGAIGEFAMGLGGDLSEGQATSYGLVRRFRAEGTAQRRLTVVASGGPLSLGPYRYIVYAGNDAPEIAAGSLTLGDSITTENLEHLADEDRFTFSATTGVGVRIRWLTFGAEEPSGLSVHVRSPSGVRTPIGNGVAQNITYTPTETGIHRIEVTSLLFQFWERETLPYHLVLRAP